MRNQKSQLLIIAMIVLLGLLCGWVFLIHRLVLREVEAAELRVREIEEQQLQVLVAEFMKTPQKIQTQGEMKEGVLADRFAGVVHLEGDALEEGKIVIFPGDLALETSADLLRHAEVLRWGCVEGGRDRLGQVVLKIARNEGENFEAVEILRDGVFDYEDRTDLMSSGFRILLIRELLKFDSSPELERLLLAEEIRAVDGELSELRLGFAMEQVGMIFYQKEQLEKAVGGDAVELFIDEPVGRNFVKVESFDSFPYLAFRSDVGESAAVRESRRGVLWIGGAMILSTFGVMLSVIWLGRRQLARARARTDLAASVAHELRTPLAGQRVVLESLLEREKYDEDYLKMALRENCRLGDLAEEFLTFSRLERGVLDLNRTAISLVPLAEQYVVSDQVILDAAGEVWALGDEAAISTVIRNLVENAVKYSDEASEVVLRVFEEGDEVGFSVSDTGCGLSKRDCARVFEQFYRVEQKLSRSQDGMGLGLAIVKRLVTQMKGRITVESELGEGSVFTVFLEKGGVQ